MTPGGRGLPRAKPGIAGRLIDVAAIAVVAFALWKFLVAPNLLSRAAERAPQAVVNGAQGVVRLGRPSGRVTFLDFWATWCEPCRLSLPLVEAFAGAHPDVDVVAVDVGEAPEVATAYARAHGIRGLAFDREGRAAAAFGVTGYPTMLVIDPKGFIRARWVGFNPAVGEAMTHARAVLGSAPTYRP